LAGVLLFAVVATMAYEGAILMAPRVAMAIAMSRMEKLGGGVNRIAHDSRIDETSHKVVLPSPDLLYSICSYDLGPGPLRVTAEIPAGTYWSLSAYDTNTDNYYSINDLRAAAPAIDLLLAQTGQAIPANLQNLPVIHAPGRRGLLLFRTLIDSEAHFAGLDAMRRKASCTPAQP
jgi:uncharacterized membrane protein